MEGADPVRDLLLRIVTAQRALACAPPDPDQVFGVLVEQVREVLSAEAVVVVQPPPAPPRILAAAGSPAGSRGSIVAPRDALLTRAARATAPQVYMLSGGDARAECSDGENRSAVILPLADAQGVAAVVVVLSCRPDLLDDRDLALLEPLTATATATVRAAELSRRRSASEAQFKATIDSMAEALVAQDLQGRVVFGNRVAAQLLGLSSDQLARQPLEAMNWPTWWPDGSPRPPQEHPSMLAVSTGEPQHHDLIGVDLPRLGRRWLVVNAVPVRDGTGRVTGVVSSFSDVTEQREQERRRRGDDTRLRAAQALTGLAWWALDVTTGRHEWSEAMFRLVGLEPGGEPPDHDGFLALLHPEDRAAAEELAAAGFGRGHQGVFRVVHPDGSVHYLQSWLDVETDREGKVTRVLGATMDVTDREVVTAELADSKSSLAAALELTRTATWDWDVRTNQVRWSTRMRELMGRHHDDRPIQVEDFLACVHPDDRDRMREVGEHTIATGNAQEAHYRVLHPDGTVRHVRALTDVRLGPDGQVVALWGTAIDVSEQVEAAANLVASEQQFRVAFDNAPIGMSMIGLAAETRGRYLRVNQAFAQMLDCTREELEGRPFLELTHPDDVPRNQANFERMARGQLDELAFEERYCRKDGSIVHAWLNSAVTRGADGQPLYVITHAIDITDRLREQAELERLALTDTLTGLANRTLLTDRIDRALARLHRGGGACAMLLLDVDRFKFVNDSLGHLVGDALLVEVAARLTELNRADATVARLGGDEFVVLLEGLDDPAQVHVIAERLLAKLREPYDLGPSADSLVATVSVGVSIATTGDRNHVDLYREADLALYRAKDAGRDQYALFDDALRAQAESRLNAEKVVREALATDRLVPYFQPIVDLHDGQIRAVEGLVRIRAEDGTVVGPVTFIDVAEETGLIVELDVRMFELVVAEYARMASDPSLGLRRVSANVSARSLEDPTFAERLRRALVKYDVDGDDIRIELTERSLLTSSPVALESLRRMLELGLQMGLDDFGTGYSALAYLQRVPLRFLKIDRSFVSRLGRTPSDNAVVAAVIDLAHAHELLVIAEGVETHEQLAALRAMGCDRAQGFLLGRPMPAAQLEELLRTDPRW